MEIEYIYITASPSLLCEKERKKDVARATATSSRIERIRHHLGDLLRMRKAEMMPRLTLPYYNYYNFVAFQIFKRQR